MSRQRELKIKIKALAAEAKIIANEERKLAAWARRHRFYVEPQNVWQTAITGESVDDCAARHRRYSAEFECSRESLHLHRVGVVRTELRHSLLAYGFLRGRPRDRVESKYRPGNSPDMERVRSIAVRFGASHNPTRFGEWWIGFDSMADDPSTPLTRKATQ